MSPTDAANPLAILLAAGVGRRLGGAHEGPKVLLDFDGRSLIERHLDALEANGIDDIVVTVGHEAARLRAKIGERAGAVHNPDYREGSLVSLWVQRDRLRAGKPVLLMDGDVLYDSRMIERLLSADGEAVIMVDRELVMGDFRKIPEHAHDWHGESVGFFKFSAEQAAALADACEPYIASGRRNVEYEEAIRDMLLANPGSFTHVDVTDLPWTEIDFPEDVAKAREVVLPRLWN
jgi:choline kinase